MSATCCFGVSPDFTIAVFYRPPNSGHAPLDFLFSTLCNVYLLSSSNYYPIGDFSIELFVSNAPLYIINYCLLSPLLTFLKLFLNLHMSQLPPQPLSYQASSF